MVPSRRGMSDDLTTLLNADIGADINKRRNEQKEVDMDFDLDSKCALKRFAQM